MIAAALALALTRLGWAPDDFWRATPLELALALKVAARLTHRHLFLSAEDYAQLATLRKLAAFQDAQQL